MTKQEFIDKWIDRLDLNTERVRTELLSDLESLDNWIPVSERLPEMIKFNMSEYVLTISGDKISVKCFDYELNRWTGSPYITTTHWQPLPKAPTK